MKNSLQFIVLFACFTIIFILSSCSDKEETSPQLSIIPSVSELVFSENGQAMTEKGDVVEPVFTVNASNGLWDVSLTPEDGWCRLKQTETGFTILPVYDRAFVTQQEVILTITSPDASPLMIYLKPQPSERDVYIAGYRKYPNGIFGATYWLNGVAFDLNITGSSLAEHIYVADGDIYVVGAETIDLQGDGLAISVPRCWKNGEPVVLEKSNVFSGKATAILKNGNDIYVTGTINMTEGRPGKAVYWKNGQLFELPAQGEEPNTHSVTFIDNDLYIGGNDDSGAIYWKNGEKTEVGYMRSYGMARYQKKIGMMGVTTYSEDDSVPAFWYEDEIYYLETENHHGSVVDGILVGEDVYMVGRDYTVPGNRAACYWIVPVEHPQDNQQVWLPADINSYANGIAVSQGDVFIVGSMAKSDHLYKAVYWLNGVEYLLDNDGSARDIFIVEK